MINDKKVVVVLPAYNNLKILEVTSPIKYFDDTSGINIKICPTCNVSVF